MGIGPAPAIRALMKVTNHRIEDVDLIEVSFQSFVVFFSFITTRPMVLCSIAHLLVIDC
jgi:hypothetical protein